MENRHRLNFETYEEGKLTLEEYLGRVVFPLIVDIWPGSILALHVRAIETVPRDDQASSQTQGNVWG